MSKRIDLNMELLELIQLIQRYKKYKHNEIRLFGDINKDDPEDATQEYFNSLPSELLNKYELSKSKTSFLKVIKYPITKEILSTEAHKLNVFTF